MDYTSQPPQYRRTAPAAPAARAVTEEDISRCGFVMLATFTELLLMVATLLAYVAMLARNWDFVIATMVCNMGCCAMVCFLAGHRVPSQSEQGRPTACAVV
jgi:hypothetical protein